MDFISRLPVGGSKESSVSYPPIEVKSFVDFDLDIVGWYAKGHFEAKQFLKAVVKQVNFAHLSIDRVVQAWAIFDDNSFELIDRWEKGAVPITLIEEIE